MWDSGKRKLYILTDKGTFQLPGKSDSLNFKDGMQNFFCLYVGNSGNNTFERH